MRLLAALLLTAPLAAADPAFLTEVAERAAKTGKEWMHTQPQAGELGYDYARAGRRTAYKADPDGIERECIVTFDADRRPYDLLLVSKRVKKDKGSVYLVDSMTLRADLAGRLLAAVRASGKNAAIVRSTAPVDDFYVQQVYQRELAFYRKGTPKPAAVGDRLE